MVLTYTQLLIIITIVWIIVRGVVAVKSTSFSLKRELQMLLAYICIAVISRFVYFELHLENGKIQPLKLGFDGEGASFRPFFFLVDRYDGWLINIIGNIAMFIPVGIVWPICFKKLDSIGKTILAGAGYTFLIEVSQLFCYGRHTDIDDLILNTTGVVIGAIIIFSIRKIRKIGKGKKD